MFPPAKRHAGSQHSLQMYGSSCKYITVADQQGLERRFPASAHQMDQVMAILNPNQGITTTNPMPFQQQHSFANTPTGQSSLGSLASTTSIQSGFSAHSSQASGLNVPQSR